MNVVWVALERLSLGQNYLPDIGGNQVAIVGLVDPAGPFRHAVANVVVVEFLPARVKRQAAAQPDHGEQHQGDADGGVVSVAALGDMAQDLPQRRERVLLFVEKHIAAKGWGPLFFVSLTSVIHDHATTRTKSENHSRW